MVGDDVCVKSVVWVVLVEVIESQPVLCVVGVQCYVMLQVLLLLYQMMLWEVLRSDREPDDQRERSGLCVYECVGFLLL